MSCQKGALCVHDYEVASYEVDCLKQILVLHTNLPWSKPIEWKDVVFEDVAAYHLWNDNLAQNVLFDVGEVPLEEVLKHHADELGELESESADALRARGLRGFFVDTSRGLRGWVLARLLEIRRVDPLPPG